MLYEDPPPREDPDEEPSHPAGRDEEVGDVGEEDKDGSDAEVDS